MAKVPSWYDGNETQEILIDGLASDPDRMQRLAGLSEFAEGISILQDQGRRGELSFTRVDALDPEMFDLISILEIATPDGSAKVSIDPSIPPQVSPTPKDATWYKAGPNAVNPNTKQPLANSVIIKARVKGDWTEKSFESRHYYRELFNRFLEEIVGVPTYNNISNAVGPNIEIISAIDDLPSPDDWNPLYDLGYGHTSILGKTPKEISDAFIGKANKRLRMLTEGGDHFYTPFPSHIGMDDNVIPVGGEYGLAEITYDVVDNEMPKIVDADGNQVRPPMNTTDGGGDMRRSVANEIYKSIHGRPLPDNVGAIQINWTGRQHTGRNGKKTGGVWKMLATIIEDDLYESMLKRDGFDTTLGMRISTDSLANQHDNPKAASGRIIWHEAKPKMYKDVAVGGLLSLPNAARYFDMEQFYERHLDHLVDELYDQTDDFERRIPRLAAELEADILDLEVETEKLDATSESSDEADYLDKKRRINQARMAEQFEAMTTGSPYASAGVMDLAQRLTLKLEGMSRNAKGANAILIPMWKGKRTDAADLPGWVEPEPGIVRLRSIKTGRGYINWIVFNREDMADPLMQKKFDGPDNDDEFGAKLARDPSKPGKLFAHVTRDPQSIGGGAFLEVDERDIPNLMRGNPYIFESFADAAANGEIHHDLVNIPGMKPKEFPKQYVDEIKSLLATGKREDYNRAWRRYSALVTGMGNTQMVTNFDALAYNSGWL